MHPEQQIKVQKRRRRSEVRQLITEFVNSGIEASEFCRSRGLSRSTLYRGYDGGDALRALALGGIDAPLRRWQNRD